MAGLSRTLSAKLMPPRSDDMVCRERFLPLMEEIPRHKVTTIIGGAGYGKSTLAVQAVKRLGKMTVWYRLDDHDKDLITFLSYLIAGIGRHVSGFGTESIERIERAENLSQERQAVLTVLLSEIEATVKDELIVVLDDYHLIQDSPEIRSVMDFTIANLPDRVHLVIISRTDVDLPLSRLRAAREVLEIVQSDLAFTIGETEQLFSKVLQLSVDPDNLALLQQKTGGWAVGLILVYHALRKTSPGDVKKRLATLKGSRNLIFKYLEENVLNQLPPKIGSFLVKTSIFTRLESDVCDRFLGIDESAAILRRLEEDHLFTFSLDEDKTCFYYHHLFQEFLQDQLARDSGAAAVKKLQQQAGRLMEANAEYEEALRHYVNGEDIEGASKLIGRIGRQLVREGRLELIKSCLAGIPEEKKRTEPWLQYITAQVSLVSGRTPEAVSGFKRALTGFRQKGIEEGVDICLLDLGLKYFNEGHFSLAKARLKELLDRKQLKPYMAVEVMGFLTFLSAYLGDMDESDRYWRQATALLPRDDRFPRGNQAWLHLTHGFRHLFAGDYHQALEMGRQAMGLVEAAGAGRLKALSHQLISTACSFMGMFDQGLENARAGLEIVKEKGLRDSNYLWLMICTALNQAGRGDTEEALKSGRESLACARTQQSDWGLAYACLALNLACTNAGDLPAAEEYALSGLRSVKGLGLPLIEGALKSRLASCLMQQERLDEALIYLREAREDLPASHWFNSRVLLLFAQYHWRCGEKEQAEADLIEGLEICERYAYDVSVLEEKKWVVPALAAVYAKGCRREYILKVLEILGTPAAQELGRLKKEAPRPTAAAAAEILNRIPLPQPPGLQIHFLGKFEASVGHQAIPARQWKSKKARMLFKYLLFHRQRGYVRKEVLMELLWSDEDTRKTAKRFHVALASLRKILEPDITPGTPSSYILSDGDAYRIRLGKEGRIDVEEFRQARRMADRAANMETTLARLLDAEALYRGDFLEEDPYEAWCSEEREKLTGEYLRVLREIMAGYEIFGDLSKCIDYADRILGRDKYAEDVYYKLMTYHVKTGNKAKAALTYEKCRQHIVKELDCPLSPELQSLYHSILAE